MTRLLVGLALLTALGAVAAGGLHLHHSRVLGLAELEHALEARATETRALARRASELAPALRVGALPPNPFTGPVQRLDTQLHAATVSPDTGVGESTAPDPALHFEFDGDDAVPFEARGLEARRANGLLQVEASEDGYLITPPVLNAGAEPLAEIAVRIRLERGGSFRLGWSRHRLDRWDPARVDLLDVDVIRDGAFHEYRIDTTHAMRLQPGKRIRTLFLIPSNEAGDLVEIDWIRIVRQRERFAEPAVGLTYHTLERDVRPAVYAQAPRELAFEVQIPERGPRFDVALGILDEAWPVRFAIWLDVDGVTTALAAIEVATLEGWRALRVDLSRFAGRSAVLRIRLGGRAGAVGFLANPRVSGLPTRPFNVLMVVEDTLRADHLGAWGHVRPTSPAKDQLAQEGVIFTRALSQATKTRPSVPSYMTGLYPATTGVWNFHDRLAPEFVTLAEILRSQGFETGSFVQNSNAGPAAGLHQGFDRTLAQKVVGVRPQNVYGERLLDWWSERRDRNVFAYVHVLDPHGTYDPPAPFDRWYQARPAGSPVDHDPRLDSPDVEQPTAEGRRLRYDGEIAHNDARFAELLAGLRALGVLDHTLIVFFSDHGEHQGEHGVWEHSPPGFLPVLNVPLLFWYPAGLPQGLRADEPVELIDVVPTVLEVAGIPPDELILQGRSLLPRMRGRTAPTPPAASRLVLSEEAIAYTRARPERVRGSVFYGPWHLLYTRHEGQKRLHVFDLARDPGETRSALPLLRFDPFLERRVLAKLRNVKAANLALGDAYGWIERDTVELDPEAREQLRALGYIE